MKEKTERNSADLMTKYLSHERMLFLMKFFSLEAREGKHPLAFELEVNEQQLNDSSVLTEANMTIGEAVPVERFDECMNLDADMDEVLAVLEALTLAQ